LGCDFIVCKIIYFSRLFARKKNDIIAPLFRLPAEDAACDQNPAPPRLFTRALSSTWGDLSIDALPAHHAVRPAKRSLLGMRKDRHDLALLMSIGGGFSPFSVSA